MSILDRDYTMVAVSKKGRDIVRAIAHHRRKAMHEVLDEILRDELARENMPASPGFPITIPDQSPVSHETRQ